MSMELLHPLGLVQGLQVAGALIQPCHLQHVLHLSGGVVPVEVEEGIPHIKGCSVAGVYLIQQLVEVLMLVGDYKLIQVLKL